MRCFLDAFAAASAPVMVFFGCAWLPSAPSELAEASTKMANESATHGTASGVFASASSTQPAGGSAFPPPASVVVDGPPSLLIAESTPASIGVLGLTSSDELQAMGRARAR